MSNIYIHEPPSYGKVVLLTTVGDIEIELWSKEAPKACRNFVQLCLEGYYDETIFHRVVKDFIVQGGDPAGDGSSQGESIYGKPFSDEFHSRIKFVRRGLVAMANSGPNDNTSHFFFTLAPTPELNKKNTIFGKIGGDTIYNVVKLTEGEIGPKDKPLYPHKIIRTKVITNPFDDIIPRTTRKARKEEREKNSKPKVQSKATKNFGLLSFGEEAEEEEEDLHIVSKKIKTKGKSSHDVLNDEKLSNVPVVEISNSKEDVEERKKERLEEMKEKFKKKAEEKKESEIKNKIVYDDVDVFEVGKLENSSVERIKKLKEESRKLKKDLLQTSLDTKDENNDTNSNNSEEGRLIRDLRNYEKLKTADLKTKDREKKTMALLNKFKTKLDNVAKITSNYEDIYDEEIDEAAGVGGDDNDLSWMTHRLNFEIKSKRVLDANVDDSERYALNDPRNPIAERRRLGEKAKKRKLME